MCFKIFLLLWFDDEVRSIYDSGYLLKIFVEILEVGWSRLYILKICGDMLNLVFFD